MNEHSLDDDPFKDLLEISSVQTVASTTDLPEGTRQILIVTSHNIVSAGYIDQNKTNSQSVIVLNGQPSPSSDSKLHKAYIRFVPDSDKVRTPQYDAGNGIIHIWLHHRNLQTVLAQIHEGSVYCWIGHFSNNHIYADIHTSH